MRRSQANWPSATYPADGRMTANWTGRTPRTLSDAFGPYTSELLHEAKRRPEPRWVGLLGMVLVGLLFALLVFFGIPA